MVLAMETLGGDPNRRLFWSGIAAGAYRGGARAAGRGRFVNDHAGTDTGGAGRRRWRSFPM